MSINNKNTMVKPAHRPVFLDLFHIRLPITGMVSIIHRLSGVLLVLLTPAAIYLFDRSLSDPAFFAWIEVQLDYWWVRMALLIIAAFFAQHFFSGMRHLILDIDWAVDKRRARFTAWMTFGGTVIAALFVLWIMI